MTALLSMAQQFSGLPIKSLIGGPLVDTAQANAMMGQAQTQFMLNTCFDTGQDGKLTPIMVNFTITRSVLNADGSPADPSTAQSSFDLPLLTIIPLNSLAVDDMTVDFEMEVKSSESQDKSSSTSSETSAKAGFKATGQIGPFSVSVHGSISHDSKSESSEKSHYQASNSAKYSIHVHAGQLPLPKGVTTIIDAFTKNIAPIMLSADESGSSSSSSSTSSSSSSSGP